jgi:MOSC domain-containing protein YiiM
MRADANVVAIHIADTAAAPMRAVESVRAVPGRGLEGDRYYNEDGSFSNFRPNPDQEVTLIEAEVLEDLARGHAIVLAPGASRRNITTRGVALNRLVGCEFSVGAVRLRGIRLCEPCGHLQRLTHDGIVRALTHRGGLRAQVLVEGTIRLGDAIVTT